MPTKKKKSTRRPAAKRAATKRPSAKRKHAAKHKSAVRPAARRAAARKPKSARRRPRSAHRARETGKFVSAAKRRSSRRVRETPAVAAPRRRPKLRLSRETSVLTEAKRRHPKKRKSAAKRKSPAHRKAHKKSASYVMSRRRPKSKSRSKHRKHKVQAWFGDSAGHSKAAKKGWKGRKHGKATKKVAESRRRPSRVKETLTVKARRSTKRRSVRASTTVQARRRPKRSKRVGETSTVRAYRAKRRVVRAPNLRSIGRSALDMGLELGTTVAGYLLADGIDRFLATYDPAGAKKPSDKFTSDGTGTLANALNVASAPHLYRYISLAALTLFPLGGSIFIKHTKIRSSVEGVGIGAGIKLLSTVWSNLLMPLLVGKDTSTPALQKSWVARLYPAEVSATLNMKSGKAAVSSGATAGTLSGGPEVGVGGKDAGPFALAGRFGGGGRGREERRGWVAPSPWQQPVVPEYVDPSLTPDPADAVPVQPMWPSHFGERHRWGLRGVGDAVQDMAETISTQTGVHPAHAVNAAMHVAAEPHDLAQALERALPHVNRDVLHTTARHLHPHVARMHGHARHPREHAEWEAARASEGFPAPAHDAPEHEWSAWHGQRAAAGLPGAPHPPEPPAPTPAHLRTRHEWRPKSGREITFERYMTTQQALGIGAGGPAASGYPGQPGLGEAFSDAVQTVAATVPDMPLENAVNATAYAAAEPCDLVRAFERAMPQIRHELARQCAERVAPQIRSIIDTTGVPLPPDASGGPAAPFIPDAPALPASPVIEFLPSPPPPSWSRSEAEWHVQERRDWDRMHGGGSVVAAAKQAAEAAAAPHPDASKPAVQAAVKSVADHAAQAASAAPPGTDVHAAATQAAKAGAADHPAVENHPAVKAAVQAAASAATSAANGAPGAGAVTAAATQAAHAAAAPHADADHPAVAAAVQAAADGAAQAASAAPPGTPPHVVAQAAKDGAQAAVAEHGTAADHPAVKAAIAAAAPAAAKAAASPVGTAGVGNPPRHLPVGPPKLGKPGPHVPKHESECGCLDDSPFLGFVGDEEEPDLLYNLN